MAQLSALGVCIAVYVAMIVAELVVRRRWRRFAFQVAVLTVVAIIGVLLNRSSSGRVSFGSDTSHSSCARSNIASNDSWNRRPLCPLP